MAACAELHTNARKTRRAKQERIITSRLRTVARDCLRAIWPWVSLPASVIIRPPAREPGTSVPASPSHGPVLKPDAALSSGEPPAPGSLGRVPQKHIGSNLTLCSLLGNFCGDAEGAPPPPTRARKLRRRGAQRYFEDVWERHVLLRLRGAPRFGALTGSAWRGGFVWG